MKRALSFNDSSEPTRKHPWHHHAILTIAINIVRILLALQAINQFNEFCIQHSKLQNQIMKSFATERQCAKSKHKNCHKVSASVSNKHFHHMFRMN